MNLLLHCIRDVPGHVRARGTLLTAAAFCAAFLATGCGGSGNGVSIGDGQNADPVIVDFPIAYIKAPLPLDDQDQPVQGDMRELLTFNVGADLYFRDRASPSALDVNITERVLNGLGDVRDVEIAYDGSSLLFAMRGPVNENLSLDDDDQPTWNIWEYTFDTDELRRVIASDLSAEIGHDVAPHYLPDGRIIFSSTRQLRSSAVLLDEGKPQFSALDEDRNEPAFVLHVMDADGGNIDQVSFNQSHDLDPSVLSNGQIVFSRWDNMGVNDSVNLYRMNPDGSALELLYGQNSHETGTGGAAVQFSQPRELDDGRVLAIVKPFSGTDGGGGIVVIDTPRFVEIDQATRDHAGVAGPAQASATINEISTAPDSISRGGRFRSAFPVQDGTGRLIVSWSQCRVLVDAVQAPCTDERLAEPGVQAALPIYSIWIYDPRDDTQLPVVPPQAGFIFPEAVAADPRVAPPVILDSEDRFTADPGLVDEGAGVIDIRSVYDLGGGATGDIATLADPALTVADERPARFLRIVKAVSLPDDDIVDLNNAAFGRSTQQGMKEIIGYAPIEPDGSVMVKVPANVALALGVLDADGRRTSARHQNWLQVRPGQLLQCNGCHVGQSGVSHGRSDAFESAWPGAQLAGVPFPNTEPALFVGTIGETMAQVRARISCDTDNCSSLLPSVDIEFEDVWTDEDAAGRPKDASFSYSYADLTTAAPTTFDCMQEWHALCRIVINYETHIHPLWSAPRPAVDGMGNPLPGAIGNECINCHSQVAPAGQLDLSDGLSAEQPLHLNAYRQLLFREDPPMRVAGALASGRFFNRFDAGQSHAGYLSDAEKRLIAEWLDVGAQYFNNPFDVPAD